MPPPREEQQLLPRIIIAGLFHSPDCFEEWWASGRPVASLVDVNAQIGKGYKPGMAKLTPKKRENLPSKEFGLPEKARTKAQKRETGNYPMPDRGHAISALRLAERQYELGNLTENEFTRIDRKARRKLRKKKHT